LTSGSFSWVHLVAQDREALGEPVHIMDRSHRHNHRLFHISLVILISNFTVIE
jgi:hypothetical protein